jgi:hypothetical protein
MYGYSLSMDVVAVPSAPSISVRLKVAGFTNMSSVFSHPKALGIDKVGK